MTIDTKRVRDRRRLRFESLDELLADADGLLAAERDGRLVRLGNWSLGQAVNHVAGWVEYGYRPCSMSPMRWPVRTLLRTFRRFILARRLMPGMRFPGVAAGTLVTEDVEAATAVARLRATIDRLKREPPTESSPAFGSLTQAEWTQLHLRHAELHLSFFRSGSV